MRHQVVMRKSFFVNVFLILIKIVSGILFKSVALIADGVHSVSDLLSDVFVILGIRHSLKPADEDHPFGHGKFEYVLSLFLGLSVMLIAFNLGKTVIMDWGVLPDAPQATSLAVVLFVIVVKLYLARYLIKTGDAMNSEIISASGKESFSDVISSAVVFVGIICMLLGNWLSVDWLLYGDKVASIVIALFIIRIGLVIVLGAIKSIQGKSVKAEICNEYKTVIEQIEGVIRVDKLAMIAYGPYYQAIVDIRVDGSKTVKEGHDVAHRVHKKLRESEKVCHVSVHVNPGGESK